MKPLLPQQKKFLAIVVVVLAAVLAVLMISSFKFRVTSVTPDNEAFPAMLGSMEIHYNKKLDKAGLEERLKGGTDKVLKTDFEGINTIEVKDKILTIHFGQTPDAGSYSLELLDIKSESGSAITTKLPFVVKDIPYDKMTAAEKTQFDILSNGGSSDEVDIDPFLQKLPRETPNYMITYSVPEGTTGAILTVTMQFFAPGSLAAPATQAETNKYVADIRKYRTEAIEWLRSEGALEKYSIRYGEPELADQFPAGKIEEGDGGHVD
jgi:hypothetical protein